MSKAYIIRAVEDVHARFLTTGEVSGSHSEVAIYKAIQGLIPTGITSAAIGTLDLQNKAAMDAMLTEFVEALIEFVEADKDEK